MAPPIKLPMTKAMGMITIAESAERPPCMCPRPTRPSTAWIAPTAPPKPATNTSGSTNPPAFGPDRFWRGDVWANTTYLVVRGLADYGFHDLAADLADRAVDNAMRHGLPERYHADTGEPLGLPDYAFGCAILSLMADGLTRNYRVEKRV